MPGMLQPIGTAPVETPWRTKRQIADYYGCDVRTITNFMRRRILPYVKTGRFVRFNIIECDQAMERFKVLGDYR